MKYNNKNDLVAFKKLLPYEVLNLEVDYSNGDVDPIHISVPAGYQPAVPKNVSLQTKFGSYSINFKVEGSTIPVLRISERNTGVFPAADYSSVVNYYKADRSKIVLLKKDS